MQTFAARFARRYPFLNDLLTRRLLVVAATAAALILATNLAMFAATVATSTNYVTLYGPVIGGDFIVFDTAANEARDDRIDALYDSETFSKTLAARFSSEAPILLSWQYPPTMLALVWPLAFIPYLASYALWVGGTGGALFLSLRTVWRDPRALFFAFATPAAFQSMITGQTGFLSAALLSTAALYAERRPILAGVAAGLLTVKPQLGLLIPIAFAAAGAWRAFAVAALTGAALAAVSVGVFGTESWQAFIGAIASHGARMNAEIFPHHKLMSVFGGLTMLGAPAPAAMAAQAGASLLLAAFVMIVWRRTKDVLLRLAALCAAAPLATPYAFYYEAALLIPPALAMARLGATTGWLRGEKWGLAALWIAPMWMPGPDGTPGVPYSFLVALCVFLSAARRTGSLLVAPRAALA